MNIEQIKHRIGNIAIMCDENDKEQLNILVELLALINDINIESIETVKDVPSAEKTANKININEYVKVRLTDYGKEIFYHQYDDLNKSYGKEIIKPSYPTVDSDGYTSFQLWCFINLYGRYIDMGVKNVIEPLEIVFESAEKTTLSAEKTTITDGDLISRDNAIELVNYALAENKDVLEVLENMPSAEKTDSFIPQEDVAGILNTVESALKGTNYEVVGYDNTDGFLKVLIDVK